VLVKKRRGARAGKLARPSLSLSLSLSLFTDYSAWNSWRCAFVGAACGLDDRTLHDFLLL